eukprot:3723597-Pyramimonas_sp.AAC.1
MLLWLEAGSWSWEGPATFVSRSGFKWIPTEKATVPGSRGLHHIPPGGLCKAISQQAPSQPARWSRNFCPRAMATCNSESSKSYGRRPPALFFSNCCQ